MMINIIVIAILSAVLIPTFGSVVANAEKAAAQADARAIYTEYVAYAAENGLEVKTGKLAVKIDASKDEYVIVENGQAIEVTIDNKKLVILTADQAKVQLDNAASLVKIGSETTNTTEDDFEIYYKPAA